MFLAFFIFFIYLFIFFTFFSCLCVFFYCVICVRFYANNNNVLHYVLPVLWMASRFRIMWLMGKIEDGVMFSRIR